MGMRPLCARGCALRVVKCAGRGARCALCVGVPHMPCSSAVLQPALNCPWHPGCWPWLRVRHGAPSSMIGLVAGDLWHVTVGASGGNPKGGQSDERDKHPGRVGVDGTDAEVAAAAVAVVVTNGLLRRRVVRRLDWSDSSSSAVLAQRAGRPARRLPRGGA